MFHWLPVSCGLYGRRIKDVAIRRHVISILQSMRISLKRFLTEVKETCRHNVMFNCITILDLCCMCTNLDFPYRRVSYMIILIARISFNVCFCIFLMVAQKVSIFVSHIKLHLLITFSEIIHDCIATRVGAYS